MKPAGRRLTFPGVTQLIHTAWGPGVLTHDSEALGEKRQSGGKKEDWGDGGREVRERTRGGRPGIWRVAAGVPRTQPPPGSGGYGEALEPQVRDCWVILQDFTWPWWARSCLLWTAVPLFLFIGLLVHSTNIPMCPRCGTHCSKHLGTHSLCSQGSRGGDRCVPATMLVAEDQSVWATCEASRRK